MAGYSPVIVVLRVDLCDSHIPLDLPSVMPYNIVFLAAVDKLKEESWHQGTYTKGEGSILMCFFATAETLEYSEEAPRRHGSPTV